MHYIRTKLLLRPVHSIYSALINQRQIFYDIFSKCSFQTIAYTLGITKLSQIGKMDSIDRRLIIIAYQSLRRDVIYIFLLFFLQLLVDQLQSFILFTYLIGQHPIINSTRKLRVFHEYDRRRPMFFSQNTIKGNCQLFYLRDRRIRHKIQDVCRSLHLAHQFGDLLI